MNIYLGFLLVALSVQGCDRSGDVGASKQLKPSRPIDSGSDDRSLGTMILAATNNASFALHAGDTLTAENDVDQALSFTSKLPSHPSHLITIESSQMAGRRVISPGQSGLGLPTPFTARVDLTNSRAQLLSGDVKGAAVTLKKLTATIPAELASTDLLLTEADEGLELAKSDAKNGEIGALRTQILDARLAMENYPLSAPHGEAARGLAVTLGHCLSASGALEAQCGLYLDDWRGEIEGWRSTASGRKVDQSLILNKH